VHVGDSLMFDVAGETFDVRVASVRKVKWDSFQPNFFIVFAPGVLDDTAGSYLTSAYFSAANARRWRSWRDIPECLDIRHR